MKFISSGIGTLALGAGFGALTSLINDVSSPYRTTGSRVVNAGWAWAAKVAEVASLLLDVGWAWAGLAVAMGWLVGTRVRGATAGVLALIAATTAYYCIDCILLKEPLAWHWPEMLQWWLASVVFGSALGAVGASIKQPGVLGLLAGLTLPAGAIVQMVFLPPGWGLIVHPAAIWVRVIVWVAATVSIGVIITRFLAAKQH
ncbi:MAG TPA: hypothetical protein VGP70_13900 [Actinomadura sp.]|nr:hypothetical protein [Actinomadura sp.]